MDYQAQAPEHGSSLHLLPSAHPPHHPHQPHHSGDRHHAGANNGEEEAFGETQYAAPAPDYTPHFLGIGIGMILIVAALIAALAVAACTASMI